MLRKLKDMTAEEYNKWFENWCMEQRINCNNCKFHNGYCDPSSKRCWVNNKSSYSEDFLNQEVELDAAKIPQLTEYEKTILNGLNEEWRYIVRSKFGLCLYNKCPTKFKGTWTFTNYNDKEKCIFFPFDKIFKTITCEDEKPRLIEALLKGVDNLYDPVVYDRNCPRSVIASGFYKNYQYIVINLGSHPCAYVRLQNDKFTCDDYKNKIKVHGGITYFDNLLKVSDDETINDRDGFLGWDYGHYNDYVTDVESYFKVKKWTTEEIVDDCVDVIEQLIEMNGKE